MQATTFTPDNDWEERLRAHYRHLFVRVILPMFLLTAAFLLFSHWRFGGNQTTDIILILFGLAALNAWLIIAKTPHENLYTLKWVLNFLLFAYVAWRLHVSSALTAVWVILTFGALVEIHQQRRQWLVGGIAFVSFWILLFLLYPRSLWIWLYLNACYIGLVLIFLKLERYLQDEMVQLFDTQLRCARVEKEAQGLQRDAAIGHSVRALTHEIKNLLGVANIAMDNLRHPETAMPKDIDRLAKALEYMGRVSHLVLDGIGSRKAPKRLISLAELRDDVQLMLGGNNGYPNIELRIEFPPDAEKYWFEERAGSTYLIVHNLMKNALEAVQEKFSSTTGGTVIINAAINGDQVSISIANNGICTTEDQINGIIQRRSITTKVNGHGLGLKFITQEITKNNFHMEIQSSEKVVDCFLISISLAKMY